ncbi:MAG: tetratricopeptide repeat protein [Saprospiraceae bacterium]
MLSRFVVLPLLFCLGLRAGVFAQEQAIRYLRPVFSPTATIGASGERGITRALAVGIERFQNPELSSLTRARRDAEAFAAFLKTPGGGSVTWDNLALLTNEDATLARVANALDWMVAESRQGDKIIVFVSTFAVAASRSDAALLFFDSPAIVTAGSMVVSDLLDLLNKTASRKGVRVFLALDFTLVQPDTKWVERWNESEPFGNLFCEKMAALPLAGADRLTNTYTFGNALIKGLLGLADTDRNEKVMVPELVQYLKTGQKKQEWTDRCALLAVSDANDWLCKAASEWSLDKIAAQQGHSQTPILKLEVQPLDEFMAKLGDPAVQRMYEDFILTIRLGQLLAPSSRCAAMLLDTLLQMERLAPVHQQLSRRMAVAYQDDSQQAINAYLQSSQHELTRRRRDRNIYKLYPQYLQRTADLLEPDHFMRPLIEVKRLYFEALCLRLDAERISDDTLRLPLAMQYLWRAVEIEPEAAFLYNEMGVVSDLMGHYRAAEDYFLLAQERSPTWLLPQANRSVILQKQNRLAEAREASITAIALNPSNPDGYVNLGLVFQNLNLLDSAAMQYDRALRIDPEHSGAYYNLACVHVQRGKPGEALDALGMAIKYGFDRPAYIWADKDLEPLHGEPDFVMHMGAWFPDFRK